MSSDYPIQDSPSGWQRERQLREERKGAGLMKSRGQAQVTPHIYSAAHLKAVVGTALTPWGVTLAQRCAGKREALANKAGVGVTAQRNAARGRPAWASLSTFKGGPHAGLRAERDQVW